MDLINRCLIFINRPFYRCFDIITMGNIKNCPKKSITFLDKLFIWSLFFTPYFNLVSNLSIVSIGSLTFQCCVNLVLIIISLMEIANVTNGQNKKLVYYHLNGN